MVIENIDGRRIYVNEGHISEVFRWVTKDGRTCYEVRMLTNHIFTSEDARFGAYIPKQEGE